MDIDEASNSQYIGEEDTEADRGKHSISVRLEPGVYGEEGRYIKG